MKTIFVDMDGVLTDFDKRYRELFKTEPGEKRDDKFSTRWEEFIYGKHFTTLEWFHAGKELIKYLNTLNVQKAILSSTGGFKRHNYVAFQKKEWLNNNHIDYPAVFVPGKEYKPGYANKNSLLIDDTLSIIVNFQKAGGTAIHHTSFGETVAFIESWLDD